MSKPDVLANGTRVLVAVRSAGGAKTLQPGVIKDSSGKGAFVQLDTGKKHFFFRTDITPDQTQRAPMVIARGERREEPTKVAAPPHFAPTPKTTPEPSIGSLFAAERVSRGISQGVAARELGIKLAELSDFEAGVDVPDDELVLRFSEAFSVDLGPLSAALERSRPPSPQAVIELTAHREGENPIAKFFAQDTAGLDPKQPDPKPAETVLTLAAVNAEAQSIEAASIVMSKAEVEKAGGFSLGDTQAPRAPAPAELFEHFIERLDAVTPLPIHRELRARWFACARDLFKLSTEAP